jgi:hypothetical protein
VRARAQQQQLGWLTVPPPGRPAGSSAALEALAVQHQLRKVLQQHASGAAQLASTLAAAPPPASGNMPLTQLQKQVGRPAACCTRRQLAARCPLPVASCSWPGPACAGSQQLQGHHH